MCLKLLSSGSKSRVIKEDIVVYKVVIETLSRYDHCFGFFYNYRYVKGKVNEVICSKVGRDIGGGFHFFTRKKDTLKFINGGMGSIGRFIVPVGSEVYWGKWYDCKCGASNRIIFDCIIDE